MTAGERKKVEDMLRKSDEVPEKVAEMQMPKMLTTEDMKKRKFTFYGDGTFEYSGFANLYEVLGFIDIHMNPQTLKQSVIVSAQKMAQKG